MDRERYETGQKLLDAAYNFWKACHNEDQSGAVQWLKGSGGELIIFTRGEYLDQLFTNIFTLSEVRKIHIFGEDMTSENVNGVECRKL